MSTVSIGGCDTCGGQKKKNNKGLTGKKTDKVEKGKAGKASKGKASKGKAVKSG